MSPAPSQSFTPVGDAVRKMFDKKIIIVTPWYGAFAGGAARLAGDLARQFNVRGVRASIFTTCSYSPYDSWWDDYYEEGASTVNDVITYRFATDDGREKYMAVATKLRHGEMLTHEDKQDFFGSGINSEVLAAALGEHLDGGAEVIALPYFHGLTHRVINGYPNKVSIIPCFHDEPQFYWETTEALLRNAKHIFFNSVEEKEMTIRNYGRRIGRKIVESIVAGVGVELQEGCDDTTVSDSLRGNYFVYAGRKENGKNVPILCEWFERYIKEFRRDTKLIFIGGGDQSLVPTRDAFIDLGFVSEEAKQSVIKNSQGVINLSANESFSIVIMEAWLLGVPVVVSAKCAVTQGHVKRSNGGLFVESVDEFALCLKYLEETPRMAKALGAQGKRYVCREFSFDNVLAKYLHELSE